MPPCVWIKPSSTLISPGPTCFQFSKFLPLNNCFHSFERAGSKAAANRKTTQQRCIQEAYNNCLPGLIRPAMKKSVFMVHDRRRMAQYDRNRVEANFVPLDAGAGDVAPGGASDVF